MTVVYDGIAEDYDNLILGSGAEHTDEVAEMATRLLGRAKGRGRCLDVGSGTGAVSQALSAAGWSVVGVDISAQESRIALATGRVRGAVVADAHRLPVRHASVDAVVSTYTHTDMRDWAGVVRAVAASLRSGGNFVYVGMHPCFVGPHAQATAGVTVLHPGHYRNPHLTFKAPGLPPGGLRARVGVRHLTLSAFLGAFRAAGLLINEFVESDGPPPRPDAGDVPWLVGVRAVKP